MTLTINRSGKIQKVALGKMIVSDQAQRELNPSRIKAILKDFDLNLIGLPVLSCREMYYYIVDGQHRIACLKEWLGEGWEAQQIECRVYSDLTEAQEANLFLDLNNILAVKAFDRFKVAVTAGRETETAIKRIVEAEGLKIASHKAPNVISAVCALRKVFTRSGEQVFARTLRIIRDAYPEASFDAVVIDGMGHLSERYNGVLDEVMAVDRLGAVRGGITTLLAKAETLHRGTLQNRAHCIAAAAVDIINSKRGSKKLPSWWSQSP